MLDFLRVRHIPIPRICAPGGLNQSGGIDRHSTARAIFPQALLFRKAQLRQKGPSKPKPAPTAAGHSEGVGGIPQTPFSCHYRRRTDFRQVFAFSKTSTV